MTRPRWLLAASLALAAPLLAACDNTLETGYAPRPLSANEADRRSFYAPAFSPAAHPEKDGGGFSFGR